MTGLMCLACNYWWNISAVDLACLCAYLDTEVCWLVKNPSELAGQYCSQTGRSPLPGMLCWRHSVACD